MKSFKQWIESSNLLGPYYHGTYHEFDNPKLQRFGIFWLTDNKKVALQYSAPHYVKKNDAWIWTIFLKPNTNIIDLADISNPIINSLREMLNQSLYSPISQEEWSKRADFGILELKPWVIGFLKKAKIDGVIVEDRLSTMPIKHQSLALFKLNKIAHQEKYKIPAQEVDLLRNQKIPDIEKWIVN